MPVVQRNGAGISLASAAAVAVSLLMCSNEVWAVPSFARQTGLACEACHTVFPELTPFGRQFKLNGYLIDNLPQVKGMTADKSEALLLNQLPPLSVQFIASYTKFNTAVPDPNGGPSQNGTVQFPEAFSLFYAGRIAPKLGGFIQVTWSNSSNTFGWDNTDIRFADQTTLAKENLTWGLTFNNSPTVQDAWNSTPAWRYPFNQTTSLAGSLPSPPPPSGTTQLDGIGNGTVAGGGIYGFWNNLVYAEFSAYGASPHNISAPLNSAFNGEVVQGVSPYGRIALQPTWGRNSLEVGLVYFQDNVVAAGQNVTSGTTNGFRDTALDAQYQFIGDDNIFSAEAIYIYEKQSLNATPGLSGAFITQTSNNLSTFRLGASYFYQRQWGGSVGYFSTSGSTNNQLYINGTPNTSGWALELDYLPWQNVKLAAQLILYSKFNGASNNYDGTGRNASGNNTLYLFAWLAF